MRNRPALLLCGVWINSVMLHAQLRDDRTTFRVKQLAAGVVYVDGGSSAELVEGMRLHVKRLAPGDALLSAEPLGDIVVASVASASALCDVTADSQPIQVGDLAELSRESQEVRQIARSGNARKRYAQVVSFTEDDPLEQEEREYVPKPPLPEVNRIRGRISFEENAILDHTGNTSNASTEGLAVRADMTRIGGTFWNFTGYWRGRMNSHGQGPGQFTLIDLMNRTYHIGLYYNNPGSKNVMGFGRLLLPWASSLNSIDGGYYGRRVSRAVTTGVFAGSTPDPTAWNYDPNRQIAGAFVNYEKGSFESLRWSSTAGLALTRIHWQPEREYLFLENGLFYKQTTSLYYNLEVDDLKKGRFGSTQNGPVVSRSFLTFRVQPTRRVTFDLNHNYFRFLPTFDNRLIGTGLLDKYLFQGLSAGVRVDIPFRLSLYTNLGRSKRADDHGPSMNELFGVTWTQVPWLRIRADARYARFNSSFGSGSYEALSLTKELGDRLRLELEGGQQDFASAFTQQTRTRYGGGTLDWLLGRHYVLGGGGMFYRGAVQSYDQLFVNLGYRF